MISYWNVFRISCMKPSSLPSQNICNRYHVCVSLWKTHTKADRKLINTKPLHSKHMRIWKGLVKGLLARTLRWAKINKRGSVCSSWWGHVKSVTRGGFVRIFSSADRWQAVNLANNIPYMWSCSKVSKLHVYYIPFFS